jgi:hypothetical protein
MTLRAHGQAFTLQQNSKPAYKADHKKYADSDDDDDIDSLLSMVDAELGAVGSSRNGSSDRYSTGEEDFLFHQPLPPPFFFPPKSHPVWYGMVHACYKSVCLFSSFSLSLSNPSATVLSLIISFDG